jgi:hypothetical protein
LGWLAALQRGRWRRAQQQQPIPKIGFLGATTPEAASRWTAAFVQRLRELGRIEGRSVTIVYRWADGRVERMAEIAADFARANVEVIIAKGTQGALAAYDDGIRPKPTTKCFLIFGIELLIFVSDPSAHRTPPGQEAKSRGSI